MAFDPGLADRVRAKLSGDSSVTERKMFGGLVFMIRGHMVVGIVGNSLMARVGPLFYDESLKRRHVRPMGEGARTMKGFVIVAAEGIAGERELRAWVDLCRGFVSTLPDKSV